MATTAGKSSHPLKPAQAIGLVHRIDVGIHLLATERLIVELRSMDAGELSTLYSWVGRLVDPAMVRKLITHPEGLAWRDIRRSDPHSGESYARQHTLYVHIYAPYEPASNDTNAHVNVQQRFNDWLASNAADSYSQEGSTAGGSDLDPTAPLPSRSAVQPPVQSRRLLGCDSVGCKV